MTGERQKKSPPQGRGHERGIRGVMTPSVQN